MHCYVGQGSPKFAPPVTAPAAEVEAQGRGTLPFLPKQVNPGIPIEPSRATPGMPERNGFDNALSVLSYPIPIFTTMSPTGMHLPSPLFSKQSTPQTKRPVKVLGVVGRVLALAALWIAAPKPAQAQGYTFSTFAGVSGKAGYNNSITGSDTSKPLFNGPNGLVLDSSGNAYVADSSNHTIRKISPTGVVTTFAGTGSLAGNTDATGNAARFASPQGPAIDSSGNIYVADFGSSTIRKITPAGVVTTLAGTAGVAGSLDGTGTAARFNQPSGVAVDNSGNLYVADSGNNQIRKVVIATGVVTTFAGSTLAGAGGSDGTGNVALFSRPRGIAVDGAGNIYVADADNNTIRKITSAGVVTTVAGAANTYGSTDSTTATSARFDFPCSLAVDTAGNIYVADQANQTIRKISTAGVTTLAGNAGASGAVDGTGTAARFYRPSGVALDGSGNLYVTDYSNDLIRKITPSSGTVTTVAGVAGVTGIQDGSGYLLISPSLFNGPSATATDAAGNVYVADTNNQVIRKISPSGLSSKLAGQVLLVGGADTDLANNIPAYFNNPAGIAFDNNTNNVYVADTGNHTIRIINPSGVVTTLAGLFGVPGSTDSTGTAATFSSPSNLVVDNNSNVYVADYGNHKIRKITPAGVVTTLAGSGTAGSADGSGAAASFNYPRGLAIDSTFSNLYVADTQNHTIRKISLAGAVVTTIAGTAGAADSKDAAGSAARFNGPTGIAVDSANILYVADTNNQTIRSITPGGAVATIASLPGRIGTADGTGKDVRFNQPTGISVDATGNVYVADYRNDTIRKGVSSSGSSGGGSGGGGGYDGGTFDASGNSGGGPGTGGPGSTTPTGNGFILRPGGLINDSSGNLYVADTGNNCIKKITITNGVGSVSIFAGKEGSAGASDGTGTAALFNGPTGLTNDGVGNLYVADTGNATIRKITLAVTTTDALGVATTTLGGVVTTFAGSAGSRGNQDGVGTAARFNSPTGIDIDSNGNLFIADSATSTIRKINTIANTTTTPATAIGTVTTFAGKATEIGETDGVGTAARFNGPTGLTIDGNGTVYVADTNNNTIRRITTADSTTTPVIPAGTITTIAGSPGISGSYDGTGNYALFSNPTGLSAPRTEGGTIFVADTGNNLIRMITPGNQVSTSAGIAGISGYRDGTASTALFNQPKALLARGNIYVADTGNSSLRIVFGTSVTGISLKSATTTVVTPPVTTPTPTTSSGGGAFEGWFAGGLLFLLLRSIRVRRCLE